MKQKRIEFNKFQNSVIPQEDHSFQFSHCISKLYITLNIIFDGDFAITSATVLQYLKLIFDRRQQMITHNNNSNGGHNARHRRSVL